jgi:hypothetical protein
MKNDIMHFFIQLENSDKPIAKKYITPESLQALIRKRIELTLSQIKADTKCSFPRNTFKDIEANRLIPSEEQRRRIQQHFGIQLKINTIEGEITEKLNIITTLENMFCNTNKEFKSNLQTTFENSSTLRYKKDYGFDIIENDTDIIDFKLCIPYLKKDTPSKKSNFSDILLRLILTFNIYITEYNSELQDDDIELIITNKNLLRNFMSIHTISEFINTNNLLSNNTILNKNTKIKLLNSHMKQQYKILDDSTKNSILLIFFF